MTICKSILFGYKGDYELYGLKISFTEDDFKDYAFYHPHETKAHPTLTETCVDLIPALADACLRSKLFRVSTQGVAHACVHEIGHAIALDQERIKFKKSR